MEAPARERENTVIGQVREVIMEGVGGVKVVLGKGESAGGRGSPGVYKCRLNHLEPVFTVAHEASPVFDVDMDIGPQIQVVAELRPPLPHDCGADDWAILNAGDVMAAGSQRAGTIPTAARADD